MDFPQYRKLSNDLVFYQINNDRNFEEIQLVGSKANHYIHEVSKYPEILRIKEMLDLSLPGIVNCNEEEYQRILILHSTK